MAEIRETEHGTFIQERNGRWRKVTPEEQATVDMPASTAVGQSLLENLRQVGISMAASAPEQQRVEEFQESTAITNRLESIRPAASQVGFQASLLPELALGQRLPVRAGLRAGRAGLTPAQRVRAEIEELAEAGERRPGIGATDVLGARSAGAAETAPRGGVLGLFDEFFTAGKPLTAQQQELIEVGNRLGFQFLPGQTTGQRQFLEALQSSPIGRQMFSFELDTNAELLRKQVISMLDMPAETQITRGILGESGRVLGARFDKIRKQIDDVEGRITLDPDDIALLDDQGFRSVLTPRQRARIDLANMAPDEMMEVRSRLNERMAQFYRNGENQAGNDVSEIIKRLDDQLDDSLAAAGKVDVMDDWRKVRQQWRVRLALQRPGVITPEGDVSLKVLTRNLEKVFEREFGQELLPPAAFREANPAIAEGLDFIRVARSFASNMPDSGTPTRLTTMQALRNPKRLVQEKATAIALRKWLDVTTPE